MLETVTSLLLPAGAAQADGALIAFYSLNETPVDRTGNNADADIVNAPYEDRGVYLNGKYVGSDPDGSMVKTPQVTALDFAALSVSVEFKISELPSVSRAILFCGSSWRWMGASLTTGGELFLNYNGYSGPASTETVTPGEWHTLGMIYDGTTGHLILDGAEVYNKDFVPVHGEDRRFVTHNSGSGSTFQGHLRNLRVYNGVISEVVGVFDDQTPSSIHILGNYPNPFNPATTITFSLSAPTASSLGVFDMTGRFVQMLMNQEMLGEGTHQRVWSGTDINGRLMPSGTYFCRLQAGHYIETQRMTLLK